MLAVSNFEKQNNRTSCTFPSSRRSMATLHNSARIRQACGILCPILTPQNISEDVFYVLRNVTCVSRSLFVLFYICSVIYINMCIYIYIYIYLYLYVYVYVYLLDFQFIYIHIYMYIFVI